MTWNVVFERFLPCVLAVAFAWGGFADEAFDCPALIARARRQPPSQSFRVTANRLRARTATFATVMSLKGESDIRIEPFPQDGRLRFSVAVKERRYVHEIADDWSAVAVREEGK